jgi:hypothetical protein
MSECEIGGSTFPLSANHLESEFGCFCARSHNESASRAAHRSSRMPTCCPGTGNATREQRAKRRGIDSGDVQTNEALSTNISVAFTRGRAECGSPVRERLIKGGYRPKRCVRGRSGALDPGALGKR